MPNSGYHIKRWGVDVRAHGVQDLVRNDTRQKTFAELCNTTGTDKCKPTLFDDHRYQLVYPQFLESRRAMPRVMPLSLGSGSVYALASLPRCGT